MCAGRGVAVHEPAGVGHETDVERLGQAVVGRDAEIVAELPDHLGRARRVGIDPVDVAEAGVVVMMVDVEHGTVRTLADLDRVAVDVAAVQVDHRAAVEILGKLGSHVADVQERVLVRQRQVGAVHHHHRVLAELAQQGIDGDQRAERVTIRALVGEQTETVGLLDHACDSAAWPGAAHRPCSCERSSSPRWPARSAVSS